MTAAESTEGNVTPLFGQREVGRFVFSPSDELAERLWGLARPSYQKEMGLRGLFLYSSSSVEVTRRTDGSLEPHDALMESDVRKVLGSRSNDTQRRLARHITGGYVRDVATDEVLGARINLRVLLDHPTVSGMKKSPHIDDEALLSGSGIQTGLFIPMRHVMPSPQFRHRYEDLERFVHGPEWHPSMLEVGKRTPSLTLGAYVTNMHLVFRGDRNGHVKE